MDLKILKTKYDEAREHLAERPDSVGAQGEMLAVHAAFDLHRIANAVEKLAGLKSQPLADVMELIEL